MESTAKHRNWMQFSLKTLMLFVVVVCSFLAGRASLVHRVEEAQAEARSYREQLHAIMADFEKAVQENRASLRSALEDAASQKVDKKIADGIPR